MMSEPPVSAGDYVLVRLEVTHRLNDGYLIVTGPGLTPIVIHEDGVLSVAAVPERQVRATTSQVAGAA